MSTVATPSSPSAFTRFRMHRRFHKDRVGDFSSITSFLTLMLMGFFLWTYFHLTFQGILEGFLHFLGV